MGTSNKIAIAYVVKTYLNITETFIYEPLRNLRRFRAIILTEGTKNLAQFPFPRIYSHSDLKPIEIISEYFLTPFTGSPSYGRAIRRDNIKLLHAHFAWEGIRMLKLKKKYGLPLITSFYGIDVYKFTRDPIFMMQLRRLFRDGDLFLTFSEHMRKHVVSLGCPEDKVITHHGGADFNRFTFSARDLRPGQNFNILMVGRFVEKKGFEYGIKAFSGVSRKYPTARLNIIGSGPLKERIENLVDELGIKDKVHLLGEKSHSEYIKELYDNHLMMAPSVAATSGDEEGGINTVIIEAFATGMPVIATDHSGSELVFEGKTGYLARERDADDLAQKLDMILGSTGSIEVLGRNARKLVEDEFDMIKQTRKLEAIYGKLIDKYGK